LLVVGLLDDEECIGFFICDTGGAGIGAHELPGDNGGDIADQVRKERCMSQPNNESYVKAIITRRAAMAAETESGNTGPEALKKERERQGARLDDDQVQSLGLFHQGLEQLVQEWVVAHGLWLVVFDEKPDRAGGRSAARDTAPSTQGSEGAAQRSDSDHQPRARLAIEREHSESAAEVTPDRSTHGWILCGRNGHEMIRSQHIRQRLNEDEIAPPGDEPGGAAFT
jgi:hypothetical protein